MAEVLFTNQAAPPTPPAGKVFMFVDITGAPSIIDEFGTVSQIGGGGPVAYPYVVGQEPGLPYSSIQTAMDDATAAFTVDGWEKQILVRPGTYTEDLNFRPGVHLIGSVNLSDPLDVTTLPTAPTVIGNHTVDITAPYLAKVQGFTFHENNTALPIFDRTSPGGFGGAFSFNNCAFMHTVTCTAPILSLSSSDNVAKDLIGFQDCIITALVAVPNAIEIDGSEITVSFERCRAFSAVDPDKGMNIAHTLAATPGTVTFHDSKVDMAVILDTNGVKVSATKSYIQNDSSTAEALVIGATSSCDMTDSLVVADGFLGYSVSGSGSLTVGGATGFEPASIDPALNYQFRGQVSSTAVRGGVQEVAVVGPTDVDPLAVLVNVDTFTAGATSTVNLPDPVSREGQLLVVYDSGAYANINDVIVTCTAASIVGGAALNKANQRLTYFSSGVAWIQIADEG